MNCDLGNVISGSGNNYGVPQKERRKLNSLREKYYQLSECSDSAHNPSPVIGKNVLLTDGYREIIERSSNPTRTGEILEEIACILKKHQISPYIYKNLGKAFIEMRREPGEDTKRAIDF